MAVQTSTAMLQKIHNDLAQHNDLASKHLDVMRLEALTKSYDGLNTSVYNAIQGLTKKILADIDSETEEV